MTIRVSTLAGMALMLCLPGCKPDAAVQKGEVIGSGTKRAGPLPTAATSTQPVAGPTGNIAGVVTIAGVVPAPVLIDTSMDPACGMGGGGPVVSEQYAVTAGKLANVFLYVKNGPEAAMQAAPVSVQPVVLDQKGCRYTPHVVGIMQGGTVEFRNSDLTMHNIHTMPADLGNRTIDISMGPKGAPVTRQMDKPELMVPVRCNNHPWMNAFVNVSATPFFAVTGTDGKFSLKGLPPGEYTLGAVQEKLGEKTMQVTVAANGTARADFSFASAK